MDQLKLKGAKAKNETLAKAVEVSKVVERPVEQNANRMSYAGAKFTGMDLTKRQEKTDPESPFQYQFKSSICDEADFSEANLEGQNFQGASLKRANLCGANCKDADFRWAIMHDVIYDENTDFTGANFWEVHGLSLA